MWQAYFPNRMIYALDSYDKRYHEDRRIKIFQGSQNDPEFLNWMADRIGRLDVIIDDGSHVSEHVRTSFKTLFPRLASPGIYAIEDLHTSYLPEFGGDAENFDTAATSMVLLKDLIDSVNYQYIPGRTPTVNIDGSVQSLHVHPKLAFIFKGDNTHRFDGIIDEH